MRKLGVCFENMELGLVMFKESVWLRLSVQAITYIQVTCLFIVVIHQVTVDPLHCRPIPTFGHLVSVLSNYDHTGK